MGVLNVTTGPVRDEANVVDIGLFLIEKVGLNWMSELSHVSGMLLAQDKMKHERDGGGWSCLKVDSNGPKTSKEVAVGVTSCAAESKVQENEHTTTHAR